ncbi:hypothetical protein BJ508DRAFT_371487 [Ascobolus immersus RN42]|uniref:Uncharacterized protein n=1 Tax=Ascobolus immersus RN42 TaxID=1160509 RepID=A0A3N4IPY8_ASCIM|nr:hypothetical protein BJ508DRAFT_371487 [Ascobolus immersus RN42]
MEPTVVEPFVPPFAPNPNGRRYTIEELLHLGNNLPIITCFINAFKPPAFEYGIFRPEGSKGRAASAKTSNRRNSYTVNLQAAPVPGRWSYPTLELIEAEGTPYQEENLVQMLSEDARNAWNAGKLHGPKSGEQTHTAFKSIGNTGKGNRANGNGISGATASGSLGQHAKTGAYNGIPSRNSIPNRDPRFEYAPGPAKAAPPMLPLQTQGLKFASTPSSILITNGRRDPKHASVSFAVPTPANTPMVTPRKSDARSSIIGSDGNIMISPANRLMSGQMSHLTGQPSPIIIVPSGGPGRLPGSIPMVPVMQPLQNHGNIQIPQSSGPFYARPSSSMVNHLEGGPKVDHESKTQPPIGTKPHDSHPLEARGNGQQPQQGLSEGHSNQQSSAARGSNYANGTGSIGRSSVNETPSMRKVPGLFGRSYIPGIAQRQQDPFKQQGLYTPINRPEQDWQLQANLYGLEDPRPQQQQRQIVPTEAPVAVARSSQQAEEPATVVSSPTQTPTRVVSGSSFASSNLTRPSTRAAVPMEMAGARPSNTEVVSAAAMANIPSREQQQEIVRQRLAMHQQRIQQIQEAQRAEQQEQDLLAMQLRRHHLIQQQQVEQMSRIQQQQLLLQQQQMAEQQRLHQLMYAQFMAGVNQGQMPVKDVHPAQMHPAAVQHPTAVPQTTNLSFSDQLRKQAEEYAKSGKHSRKSGKVKHY